MKNQVLETIYHASCGPNFPQISFISAIQKMRILMHMMHG